jgi:hypothetical protein
LLASKLAKPTSALDVDDELIADLAQAESLTLTLADRLRASYGIELALSLATHDAASQRVRGTVERVGVDHVVLRIERGLALVRLGGVVTVVGLGAGARPASGLDSTWTWRATMRRWIGDEVVAHLTCGSSLRGTLQRVAADHFDLQAPVGAAALIWAGTAAVLNHNADSLDPDAAFEV